MANPALATIQVDPSPSDQTYPPVTVMVQKQSKDCSLVLSERMDIDCLDVSDHKELTELVVNLILLSMSL